MLDRRVARLSPPWLLGAALAFLADLFLHLPITDLCDVVAARLGLKLYDRLVATGFALLAVATLIVITRSRSPAARFLAVGAAVLVALAVIVQKTLLVASIENVHYPQYALLAILLGRGGFTAEVSWLAATALGGLDEMHQWLFMHRGTFEYFDWNDVFLNAIGAAFGVIALRLMTQRPESPAVRARVCVSVLGAGLAAALIVAPPALPFFRVTPSGLRYHVLPASEGIALIGLVWLGARYVVRRSARPAPM
jgi:hypothetical protein